MLNLLDKIFKLFRPAFSHETTFNWFILVTFGFIIRFDHSGVTSIIRWLFLKPTHYDSLLLFFRTSSWKIENLLSHWITISLDIFPVMKFNDRLVLIGDGIKICKEAQKMPGVKRLHQDSQNSSKKEIIWGHHIGYVGLLVGSLKKAFCLPLHGQLHEGIDNIRLEKGINGKPPTIVTRMANLSVETAKKTGHSCYVTLDAYFSTGPAFTIFKATTNEFGQQTAHLITRAKDSYVGYFTDYEEEFLNNKYHKDNKVKIIEWFDFPDFFKSLELTTFNKTRTIEYAVLDLFWRPIDDVIRFVCVKDGAGLYILMSSDLNLSAKDIITIYSYRSKIEVMFLFLKHLVGGFCYHFWTKSMPKLNRRKKNCLPELNDQEIIKARQVVEACEKFINLAGIALGILQYLALTQASMIWTGYSGWMRTYSSEIPSEAVVQNVIQIQFFSAVWWKVPFCLTLRVVRNKMRRPPIFGKGNFQMH